MFDKTNTKDLKSIIITDKTEVRTKHVLRENIQIFALQISGEKITVHKSKT